MADSQVEKFPYSCRQLLMNRLFSSVNRGEISPAVEYDNAPPTAPDISDSVILCCASRSVKKKNN